MRDLEYFLDIAYRLGIIEQKPDGYDLRQDKKDLNKISFPELHELLILRGHEIGYRAALREFERKGYLDDIRISLLKDTLFKELLREELEEENYLPKTNEEESEEIF